MKLVVSVGLCLSLFMGLLVQTNNAHGFSIFGPNVTDGVSAGATLTISWSKTDPNLQDFVIVQVPTADTDNGVPMATVTGDHDTTGQVTITLAATITGVANIEAFQIHNKPGQAPSTDSESVLGAAFAAVTIAPPASTSTGTDTGSTQSTDQSPGSATTAKSGTFTGSSSSNSSGSTITDPPPPMTSTPESQAGGALTSMTSSARATTPTSSGPESSTTSSSTSPSFENAATTSSKKPVIVGAVIGSVVFLAILLIAALLLYKKRQRAKIHPHIFHRDMMVKSTIDGGSGSGSGSYRDNGFSQDRFAAVPIPTSTGGRRTLSTSSASSTSSILDNEKTPALTGFVRVAESGSQSHTEDEEESAYAGRPLTDSREGLSRYGPTLTNEPTTAFLGPRLSAPRTDRQMELQDRIHDLQARLISLHDAESQNLPSHALEGRDADIEDIKMQIRQLEELQQSDWALQMTDEIPRNYGDLLFRARFGL